MSAIAGRVLLIPKGAYNALTTYNPLDFVTYGADSYVCKQTSTGNAPTNTTYWQLLAKGSTDADQVAYDNTASGMSATDVQAAVDELASEKQDKVLSTPIIVEGVSKTTVEDALNGLNGYADNISDVISKNGAKNLLPNTAVSKTENGITFTVNSDGTVTVSGTASAQAVFTLCNFAKDDSINQYQGTIKISGCPSGGSNSTFMLDVPCKKRSDNTWAREPVETGNGTELNYVANYYYASVLIVVASGTVISTPITFKPMITLASQPDSDYAHYVQYAMTNRELTEKVIPLDSFITISSSSANLSSQSDLLTWFANNITTLPKNKLIPIHINYSGWDSCDGYCIIQSISNKTYKVEVSNGGGRHMDIEVVNGTMTVNKYIDFSNSW